jgi:hypothetical protein
MEGSMPVRAKKFHPALKHAAYSSMSVLPGENAAEFEKLHRDLIAEFIPNGAYEKDIVATMARVLWRKQNLQTFRIAELARRRCSQIRSEKLPENEFLLPLLMAVSGKEVDAAVRAAAIRAAEDQARKELGDIYELAEIDQIATVDHLIKDPEILERLDALFDKCVKRLLMARELKSITSSSSSAPPKRLQGPSRAA